MDSIGREIRENQKEWERQRRAKWVKEHPRLHAATTGWGKAVKKEGKALGATLAHEGRTLVNDIDRELGKLFSFR